MKMGIETGIEFRGDVRPRLVDRIRPTDAMNTVALSVALGVAIGALVLSVLAVAIQLGLG